MDVDDRFWAKIKWTPSCWVWVGAKNKKGYGNFNVDGKYVAAHRHSWKLEYGPIPVAKWVLHKCDNPSCVRPDHLFLGDVLVNNRDMWSKGRGKSPYFVGHDNSWRWKRAL